MMMNQKIECVRQVSACALDAHIAHTILIKKTERELKRLGKREGIEEGKEDREKEGEMHREHVECMA